jgi:D-sedoheptulose 7-phosphate isomerase
MKKQFEEQIRLIESVIADSSLIDRIEMVISCLTTSLENRLPVLVCGNGGSAADALHITGELVGRFYRERKAMNVICLNSNVTVMTAWANDYEYESNFARQVEAHGVEDGICWGISTSGNSESVVEALRQARKMNMKTIGLTGTGGGKLASVADLLLDVPSSSTPRIQELHMQIYHFICEQVEMRVKD